MNGEQSRQTQEIMGLLTRLQPDPYALRKALRQHVPSRMLEEIANADGGYGYRENLPLLRGIRNLGKLPSRLKWFPKEVLELERWSTPARYDRRRHLKRAFACGALIEAGGDPANHGYIPSENETLAALLDSVRGLGVAFSQTAVRLISWRLLLPEPLYDEYPFFACALLLLCVDTGILHREPASLLQLADWVLSAEAQVRHAEYAMNESDHWLLGLTLFDQRHDLWKALARDILLTPRRLHPALAAERLIEIGQKLAGLHP
jgi:hypothetical protein